MATVLFDATAFRTQFPNQFLDPPNTDAVLELYWDAAICYVDPRTSSFFDATCLRQLLNLVTAHLLTLGNAASAGQQSFRMLSASIDKITVATQGYTVTSQYQWFWNQTPYGMQAYVRMTTATAGGFYLGNGINEQGSFRRAGGVFTPPNIVTPLEVAAQCSLATSAPSAPFDFDFGLISGGDVFDAISVPAGCDLVTIEFQVAGAGAAIDIAVWSGFDIDSGNRFNLYYWDSDDRAGGNPPTAQATNFAATGATPGSGFVFGGIFTGSTGNDPHLVALSGFSTVDAQVINVDIQVA